MSFISYAQNFEDVMLWRALKHVEGGFYIDVGAWSPDRDSVTRAFYDRGWHGINVEPNPEFHALLQERRGRDKNLPVAVGDVEGVVTMNFVGNPGLSTLDDAIADVHKKAGWPVIRQNVQITTLAKVWMEHLHGGEEVHFLKVDVEGFEEAALRGNDWTRNRPWIVVVEATIPMSQLESYESWEPILLGADYRLAYVDGLNRFYVANEHSELHGAFKYPPNYFDDFVLSAQQEAVANVQETRTRAERAEAMARQAVSQLQAIKDSASWRWTAPLRRGIDALAQGGVEARSQGKRGVTKLRQRGQSVLVGAMRVVLRDAMLSYRINQILLRWPEVHRQLVRIARRHGLETRGPGSGGTVRSGERTRNCGVPNLTPRAVDIYSDLKTAIEFRRREQAR